MRMALTKKDIKQIGSVVDAKLDAKLKPIKIQLQSVDKKITSLDQKVTDLTEFVVPAIGNILEWTDGIHRAIVGKPSRRTSGN